MPVCDWLKISRGNLLGSCEEKQTFIKLFKGRANKLIKMLTLEGKNTRKALMQHVCKNFQVHLSSTK